MSPSQSKKPRTVTTRVQYIGVLRTPDEQGGAIIDYLGFTYRERASKWFASFVAGKEPLVGEEAYRVVWRDGKPTVTDLVDNADLTPFGPSTTLDLIEWEDSDQFEIETRLDSISVVNWSTFAIGDGESRGVLVRDQEPEESQAAESASSQPRWWVTPLVLFIVAGILLAGTVWMVSDLTKAAERAEEIASAPVACQTDAPGDNPDAVVTCSNQQTSDEPKDDLAAQDPYEYAWILFVVGFSFFCVLAMMRR